MSLNVFVLGLDQGNLEILRRLPGAADLAFHALLPRRQLLGGRIDIPALLHRAESELEAFDGSVDAIVSFWDFPMVTLVPILCPHHLDAGLDPSRDHLREAARPLGG